MKKTLIITMFIFIIFGCAKKNMVGERLLISVHNNNIVTEYIGTDIQYNRYGGCYFTDIKTGNVIKIIDGIYSVEVIK